jgi:stress response protein YsnF
MVCRVAGESGTLDCPSAFQGSPDGVEQSQREHSASAGTAAGRPVAHYAGDTYVVPIVEEVVVTEKRVRIRQELHITRRRSLRRHVETVLLKSETVSVTPFDDGAPGQTQATQS